MTNDEYKSVKIKESTIRKMQEFGTMTDSYDTVINRFIDYLETFAKRYNMVDELDIDNGNILKPLLNQGYKYIGRFNYNTEDKCRVHEKEFTSACIAKVIIKENGIHGGDAGHGGFVNIIIKDEAGTYMEQNGKELIDKISFTVKGDAERGILSDMCLYISEVLKNTKSTYPPEKYIKKIDKIESNSNDLTFSQKKQLLHVIDFFRDSKIKDVIKKDIMQELSKNIN